MARFWRHALAGCLLLGVVPSAVEAEDVHLGDLFKAAKDRPIKRVIVILAAPGDTLVVRPGDRFFLDGMGLFVSADAVRVEGDAEIQAFSEAAGTKPGTGGKGPDGQNQGGAADPSNRGATGGNAGQGAVGEEGSQGATGALVRFEVGDWTGSGKLNVKNHGQKGGQGQQGGTGGTGGQGQKGGQGKSGAAWCDSGGGDGGTGGQGGVGGTGGKGGAGGAGGQVILSGRARTALDEERLIVSVEGGPGGEGGLGGAGGSGGQGGQGGDGNGHCGGGNGGPSGPPGPGGQTGGKGEPGTGGEIKKIDSAI